MSRSRQQLTTGVLFAIALSISACQQLASVQTTDTSQPVESTTQLVGLNFGDLQYLDKLLLQRDRSTAAHQERATEFLQFSLEWAAEDKASDYAKGYEGIGKVHCPSAMMYPTNESLIICAESELVSDLQSVSKVDRFRYSARIYRAVLAFSERVDEPLSLQQREAVETNFKCLDSFLENAVTPSPTCQLRFTTLR